MCGVAAVIADRDPREKRGWLPAVTWLALDGGQDAGVMGLRIRV
jgi:hypothetical protein